MKGGYQYLYTLFMVVSLGFSGWYLAKPKEEQLSPQVIARLPDMIIEGLHVTRFNEDGTVNNLFASPKLIHYPEEDRSYFTRPQITILQDGKQPWHIQAKHGNSNQGADTITLSGQVRLHQPSGTNRPSTTIATSQLIYLTQQQLAKTDRPITLQQPGMTIKSIGMLAKLDQENVQLLSNTQGYYEKYEYTKSTPSQ